MRNGTFRSVALVALVPLVMAVAGVLVLQSQLRARLVEATQTRLLAEAQGFAALYDQRRIVALREAIAYRSTRGDPAGSVYVLTDRAGAVLAGNLDGWPDGIAVQDTPGARFWPARRSCAAALACWWGSACCRWNRRWARCAASLPPLVWRCCLPVWPPHGAWRGRHSGVRRG